MQNKRISFKVILFIFILFSCIFYIDKIVLGPYASVRLHDTFDNEYARIKTVGNLFLKHGLFSWYPNVCAGLPSYAYHYGPYYVLSLLSIVFAPWLIYTLSNIFLMAIAGFGMYWFLKDFLGVKRWLSFAGGALFSLYSQVQYGFSPLMSFNYIFPAFFMCQLYAERQKSRVLKISLFIFLLFSLYISFITLTFPMFFLLQLLVVLLLNFQKKEETGGLLIKTFLVWSGYILLSLPTLYANFKLIPFWQRLYRIDYSAFDLKVFLYFFKNNIFNSLISVLKESGVLLFFIGLIPLLVKSHKMRRVFFIFLFGFLLTVFYTLRHLLPIISGTIFQKVDWQIFIYTLPFLAVTFVIAGFQELSLKKYPKVLYLACFLMAASFCAWLILHKHGRIEAINLTVTALALSLYLYRRKLKLPYRRIPLLIFSILLFFIAVIQFRLIRTVRYSSDNAEEAFYKKFFENNRLLATLEEKEKRLPFRVGTVWVNEGIPIAIAQSYGLETVDIRGPMQFGYYKEYFKEIIRPQLTTIKQEERFAYYWTQLYLHAPGLPIIMDNRLLLNLPLLLMPNTKYLISEKYDSSLAAISEQVLEAPCDNLTQPDFRGKLLMKLKPNFKFLYCTPLFVYKLKDSFERGFLAKEAVILASDKEVLAALAKQTTTSLRQKAFFATQDSRFLEVFPRKPEASPNPDKLSLTHYSPDKLVFEGSITSPSILVVTNSYHPNWKARLNGREAKILRANHAFQAILIPKEGRFTAAFTYQDPWLWRSHTAIPIGMFLVGLGVFYKKKER